MKVWSYVEFESKVTLVLNTLTVVVKLMCVMRVIVGCYHVGGCVWSWCKRWRCWCVFRPLPESLTAHLYKSSAAQQVCLPCLFTYHPECSFFFLLFFIIIIYLLFSYQPEFFFFLLLFIIIIIIIIFFFFFIVVARTVQCDSLPLLTGCCQHKLLTLCLLWVSFLLLCLTLHHRSALPSQISPWFVHSCGLEIP